MSVFFHSFLCYNVLERERLIMLMTEIIEKKKLNLPLSKEEINFFIKGYVNNEIPDYQVSALLMAICFNSMTKEETFALTESMLYSGDVIDLSMINGVKIDRKQGDENGYRGTECDGLRLQQLDSQRVGAVVRGVWSSG